ncbi:MAG: SPOR domain-containing protein [Treponema sp.]|jgi:DedD protein|nr:SPOR domain-containing protein [Treponema sp.]
MEQKKILLVTISVGVFLVIVIGAAIMLLGTSNSSPNLASGGIIPAGSSFPAYTNPSASSYSDLSYTSPPEVNSGIAENQSNEPAVPEITVTNPVPTTVPANTTTENTDSSTVINVSRPSTAAVPDATPPSRPAPTVETTPARTAPSSTASTQSSAPPSSTAATATAQPARTNPDYWVQTGSFSTLARAEGVKDTLFSKGITSIIENRTIDGTLYYRVRVGPYTTKTEADYWLALIKSINGFEQSQVWQSQ